MKKIVSFLVAFVILLLSFCSTRKDIVFDASDELHYLILYKKGYEFELLYNGYNTAIGKYSIKGDTILLKYDENQFSKFNPNEKLTTLILIDSANQRIKSIDNKMPFCAVIQSDNRSEISKHFK